tara:strand:- start:1221 stop:1637 length:417 start_codon:yes stop_codon:yes gene_type:complete
MDKPQEKRAPESWYVVFGKADHPYWWNRFLKPTWMHITLLHWDGYNWIKCEPNLAYIDISILTTVQSDTVQTITSRCGHTAVEYLARREVIGKRQKMRAVFALCNCVETAKAVLGIRAWYVFTPWQLFKYIRRQQYGK